MKLEIVSRPRKLQSTGLMPSHPFISLPYTPPSVTKTASKVLCQWLQAPHRVMAFPGRKGFKCTWKERGLETLVTPEAAAVDCVEHISHSDTGECYKTRLILKINEIPGRSFLEAVIPSMAWIFGVGLGEGVLPKIFRVSRQYIRQIHTQCNSLETPLGQCHL